MADLSLLEKSISDIKDGAALGILREIKERDAYAWSTSPKKGAAICSARVAAHYMRRNSLT